MVSIVSRHDLTVELMHDIEINLDLFTYVQAIAFPLKVKCSVLLLMYNCFKRVIKVGIVYKYSANDFKG